MALFNRAGVTGARADMETPLAPALQAALLTQPAGAQMIGEKEIQRASQILKDYKDGKAALEDRIVDDELWWELRHWESIRRKRHDRHGNNIPAGPEPSSAWLFNSILNKHADAMDNFPEPVALPRERSDEKSAKTLSEILPVIMEYNEFEQTYSDNWWEKLKHGTAAYGVFWNSDLENGLGDVDIKEIDLLKLFWQPGITDIQDSRNVFVVELVDTDLLDQEYPENAGKFGAGSIDVKQYIYDDTVDTSDKSVVVDWYYKVKAPSGRTILHYAKFCGDFLMYASQNDKKYAQTGYYAHGKYPIVLDVMFPEKGTPAGFGYVAICKDPQLYIDKLSSNILENSMMATKKRFFAGSNTNINKEQFLDWSEPIVTCEGEIDDRKLKEITVSPLDGIYVNVLQMKIEEMKDTAANRDVNSGGTGSGVTAAAAIAALQEAGNKASRDMISASYRAQRKITELVIEVMRQFYDFERSFRIVGSGGTGYEFVSFSNAEIRDQSMGLDADGNELFRRPIFDIKIKAQKKNPFSRVEQNEYAKELYGLGFFNPERAQEASLALDMMEFEGADKVRDQVMQGETLLNIVKRMSQQMEQLSAIMQASGILPAQPQQTAESAGGTSTPKQTRPTDMGGNAIRQAQQPMTGYGERLAKRSVPDMDAGG